MRSKTSNYDKLVFKTYHNAQFSVNIRHLAALVFLRKVTALHSKNMIARY